MLDQGFQVAALVLERVAERRRAGRPVTAPVIDQAAVGLGEFGDLVLPVFGPVNLAVDEDHIGAGTISDAADLAVEIPTVRVDRRPAHDASVPQVFLSTFTRMGWGKWTPSPRASPKASKFARSSASWAAIFSARPGLTATELSRQSSNAPMGRSAT